MRRELLKKAVVSLVAFKSEMSVRRRSRIMFVDWRAARWRVRSIVFLVLLVGHLASQESPHIKKSGVCTFGVCDGGMSSMFSPRSRKKAIVNHSCHSRVTWFDLRFLCRMGIA